MNKKNDTFDVDKWVKTVKPLRRGPLCTVCANVKASDAIVRIVELIDNGDTNISLTSMLPMLDEQFDLIVNRHTLHNHVREHVRKRR